MHLLIHIAPICPDNYHWTNAKIGLGKAKKVFKKKLPRRLDLLILNRPQSLVSKRMTA